MVQSAASLEQKVAAIRIKHHVYRCSNLNQSVDQPFRRLDVNIVVSRAVDQQKCPANPPQSGSGTVLLDDDFAALANLSDHVADVVHQFGFGHTDGRDMSMIAVPVD